MDIQTVVTLVSIGLAIATFFIGRQSASHSAGKESGSLATDLHYIKESVDRIEKRFDSDVSRLEGRIDEISQQSTSIGQEAARARESAKSAHHRIDEHLKRDHEKDVVRNSK